MTLPCRVYSPGAATMKQSYPVRITTQRLVLEPLVPTDATALFAYRSDDDIARYQGWKPASTAEAAAFIDRQASVRFGDADTWYQLAIREMATDALLGDLGLHFPASTDDAIEFGVTLTAAAQGKGFAREALSAVIDLAFKQWGYRRAVASVDPRNAASVAMLRALGFRQEAHHVESYSFRGEWVDDMVFALLAREWPRG